MVTNVTIQLKEKVFLFDNFLKNFNLNEEGKKYCGQIAFLFTSLNDLICFSSDSFQ